MREMSRRARQRRDKREPWPDREDSADEEMSYWDEDEGESTS